MICRKYAAHIPRADLVVPRAVAAEIIQHNLRRHPVNIMKSVPVFRNMAIKLPLFRSQRTGASCQEIIDLKACLSVHTRICLASVGTFRYQINLHSTSGPLGSRVRSHLDCCRLLSSSRRKVSATQVSNATDPDMVAYVVG